MIQILNSFITRGCKIEKFKGCLNPDLKLMYELTSNVLHTDYKLFAEE